MKNYNYKEFKNLIYTNRTRKFLETLNEKYVGTESYEYSDNVFYKNTNYYIKVFIDMLEAYNTVDTNPNPLLNDYYRPRNTKYITKKQDEDREFSNLLGFLLVFDDENDYTILTPEDILYNMIKKVKNIDEIDTVMFPSQLEKLSNELEVIIKQKHEEIKRSIHNKIVEDVNPSTANYLRTACSIYNQLEKQRDNIKIDIYSDSDLIELSLLLSTYIYPSVNTDLVYDEKSILSDYLEERGLSYDKIIELLGVQVTNDSQDISDLELIRRFKFVIDKFNTCEKTSRIVDYLLNNNLTNSKIKQEVFNNLSITDSFIHLNSDVSKQLDNSLTFDKYMQNFKTSTSECITYIVNLYTYLEDLYKKGNISSKYIDNTNDLVALTLLLASFEYSVYGSLGTYMDCMKITREQVLSLLGIHEIIVPKDFNYGRHNLYRFTKFIPSEHQRVNIGDIIDKATNSSNTNSSIIQDIHYKITGFTLEKNFSKTINEFFAKRQSARKNELETKLLSDISLDVYNYLKCICNNYSRISIPDISTGDKASLAIILAAFKTDSCFYNLLKDRGANIDGLFNLTKNVIVSDEIDIDLIDSIFKDYIFDRNHEDITIYSILENGFKNDNTFLLKKVLFDYNINIDDYKNIATDILPVLEDYRIKKEQEEIITTSNHMYNASTEVVKPLFDNSLKVFNYLLENKDKSSITLDEEDIKVISLIIGLFIVKDESVTYFEQNGVTLDLILNLLNIPRSFIDTISNESPHTELLVKYKDDFKTDNDNINITRILVYIFSLSSLIVKRIIDTINIDYNVLKDEVLNKKIKTISPEEGITILEGEVTPKLDASSLLTIASYGDNLSKHSRIISDSLTELMMKDSIIETHDDMNNLFATFAPKKKGLLKIFKSRKSNYSFDKNNLGSITSKATENRDTLRKELVCFDFMRRYIEIYLRKMNEHLKELQDYKNGLLEQMSLLDENDIEDYTQLLNFNTLIKIIDNKISTFTSNVVLMKQELIKVHRIIISHNKAIDALDTATNTIIPLIGHETLTALGTRTEMETNQITNELVDLLKNVVTYNALAAQDSLNRLKLTCVDQGELAMLTSSIDSLNSDENPSPQIDITKKNI